jgi:hypothetical protein
LVAVPLVDTLEADCLGRAAVEARIVVEFAGQPGFVLAGVDLLEVVVQETLAFWSIIDAILNNYQFFSC